MCMCVGEQHRKPHSKPGLPRADLKQVIIRLAPAHLMARARLSEPRARAPAWMVYYPTSSSTTTVTTRLFCPQQDKGRSRANRGAGQTRRGEGWDHAPLSEVGGLGREREKRRSDYAIMIMILGEGGVPGPHTHTLWLA